MQIAHHRTHGDQNHTILSPGTGAAARPAWPSIFGTEVDVVLEM